MDGWRKARETWQRLTEPVDRIHDPEERELARLLTSLLFGAIFLVPGVLAFTIIFVQRQSLRHEADFLAIVGLMVVLWVPYALVRRGHTRIAAALAMSMSSVTLYVMAIADRDHDDLGFLLMPIVFGSAYLPTKPLLVYLFINVVAMMVSSMWLPGVTARDIFVKPVSFVVSGTVLTLIFARYRERIASQRRVRLLSDGEELRKIEATLVEQTAALARTNDLVLALSNVAARLRTTIAPDAVMETVGRELLALGTKCIIMLVDRDDESLSVVYTSISRSVLAVGERLMGDKMVGYRLSRDQFAQWDPVVEQQRSVFSTKLTDAIQATALHLPRFVIQAFTRLGSRPAAGTPMSWLPLVVEGRTLGVLVIWSERAQFGEQDMPGLTVFAAQMAAALEAARLYTAQVETAERLSILRDIEQRVLAAYSIEAIIRETLERLTSLAPAEDSAVVLKALELDEVVVYGLAQGGDHQRSYPERRRSLARLGDLGYILDDLAQGDVYVTPDLHREPARLPAVLRAMAISGVHALLAAPLVYKSELIGALVLTSTEIGVFDENHADIASQVSHSLAVALRQAQLHANLETHMQRLSASLAEKDILLKEIHHRVKNNLQIISSLLRLQAARVPDPQISDILMESQHRVRSMAMIHEGLYLAQDLAHIELGRYTEDLVGHLIGSYAGFGVIDVDVDSEPVALSIDQAVPCGLILTELVTNALQHAFPDGRHGRIHIEVAGTVDGARIVISDDGVGLPDEVGLARGDTLGLQLVRALVAQLGGSLDVADGPGTTYTLQFSLGATG